MRGAASVVPPAQIGQVLFTLRSANMQLTTDQQFTRLFAGVNYRITDIIAVRKTGAGATSILGGIYDAASKGGSAIVAVGQNWVTLAANVNVVPTLAAVVATALLSGTPYLSLSTGSTGACTADLFILGYCID